METVLDYRDRTQTTELTAEGGRLHLECSLCGDALGSYTTTTLAEVQAAVRAHRHRPVRG